MLINQNLSVVIDNERSLQLNQDSSEGNLCQQTSNEEDLQIKDQNIATDTASINTSTLLFAKHNQKTITLNMEALIGLAINTAIFRSDYDNQTDIEEFEWCDCWDDICERALESLKWVGLDTSNIHIDKYSIAQSFCGMDRDSLDDLLADHY
jgi:hypothetical protein